MLNVIRPTLVIFAVLTILTGAVYPAVVTVIAQLVFPYQANGSIDREGEKVIGSRLIGQPFTSPEYFWGRLSSTSPVPYNGAASSGSNLGPLNPALRDAAKARLDALKKYDRMLTTAPVDLLTASGSGLDPHISPAAAEVQAARVAAARNMKVDDVRRLIAAHMEGRQLGVLGEPRVNVLQLNLALDKSK